MLTQEVLGPGESCAHASPYPQVTPHVTQYCPPVVGVIEIVPALAPVRFPNARVGCV